MFRPTRDEMVTLFVFSAALIDVFAVPLLVMASQARSHINNLPVVAEASEGSSTSNPPESRVLDLDENGSLTLDGKPISWGSVREQLSSLTDDQQILVQVHTMANGQGPVEAFFKLSILAQESGAAERLRIVTSEGTLDTTSRRETNKTTRMKP